MRGYIAKAFIAVFFFLASSAGCSKPSSPSPNDGYIGPKNICAKDRDCVDGGLCRQDLTLCVADAGTSERDYYVRVTPLGSLTQTFAVDLDETGSAQIALDDLEQIDIDVKDENGVDMSARVIISDLGGAIPGMPPTVHSFDIFDQGKGENADEVPEGELKRIALLPGEHRYAIKIVPYGAGSNIYPEAYFEGISVFSNTGNFLRDAEGGPLKVLQVPEPTRHVNGQVMRGSQPVSGVTVEIVDPETGRISSTESKTECSVDVTPGTVCGTFVELKHTTQTEMLSFRISKPEENRYPVVIKPNVVENNMLEAVQYVTLSLDPLATPVVYPAKVERPVSLESGVVWDGMEGCIIMFESDAIAGGSVSVSAVTDFEGRAEVSLFPGVYRITVIPPNMFSGDVADFALLEESRFVENIQYADQIFSLQYRPKRTARVVASGVPVPGSVIYSEPINHESPYARSSQSTVDPNGNLVIWLDPGLHRLTTEIPNESGFAYNIQEIFVETDESLKKYLKSEALEDIKASRPFVATLSLSSQTIDVAHAEIEWYEIVQDRAILVGKTTADKNGEVVALLPPNIIGTN